MKQLSIDTINLMINMYNNGKSGDEISKELNIHRTTVYRLLNKNNVKMRNDSQKSLKYFCNDKYFEIINTEEKAYWLGFIAADGYIQGKQHYFNRSLCIALAEKDKEHIEKFKNCINATHPIHIFTNNQYNKKYARITITNEKVCLDLEKLGVPEHKSLILQFPNTSQIPENLQMHYIRGYFDGDGSLKKKGKIKGYDFSLLSTREFLGSVKDILNINHNLKKCNPIMIQTIIILLLVEEKKL
jgi:intein-encoded DNA endonuclease-like protein